MKEDLLKQFLEKILGKSQPARGGEEAVFFCPSCKHHKKKLTFNLLSQKFQCWVCGIKGHRAYQLLKLIKAPGAVYNLLKDIDSQYNFKQSQQKETKISVLNLPENIQSLTTDLNSNKINVKHALHYLNQRGITHQDIVKYDIHYCEQGEYKNMVVIPSYDANGILNYFVGRSFDKNAYIKHKLASTTKDIIGFEMLINWDLPVILCEGIFDAISIKRNAIPLFGKRIPPILMKKIIQSNVQKIYLALDKDALKDALKHAETFINFGKKTFLIEMEDKDPNELGFEEFTKLLHKATELTTSSLMKKKLALS
tara:strand:+ start:246 stop:1178 length:933 start_codon:yes stop_codon:yes gene_type:complete